MATVAKQEPFTSKSAQVTKDNSVILESALTRLDTIEGKLSALSVRIRELETGLFGINHNR